VKSIKEAESKEFCKGKHTLTYGAWQERQEAEVEKVEAIAEVQEPDKIAELEQKLAHEKKEEGK